MITKKINFIFFILTLGYSTLCVGQTKSETENWILEKSEEFAINNMYNRELKIENGYFTYYEKIGDTQFYERILIKNISKIQIKKEESADWGYTIKVFCNGKGCMDSGHYIDGKYKNTTISYTGSVFYVNVYLNKNFENEDLPKRMEKALIHLVKLYGGVAKAYKETF